MPHGPEIWVIVGIIVLLFGAKKIPELAKSLGTGLKEFKKSTKELEKAEDEPKATEPGTDPAA